MKNYAAFVRLNKLKNVYKHETPDLAGQVFKTGEPDTPYYTRTTYIDRLNNNKIIFIYELDLNCHSKKEAETLDPADLVESIYNHIPTYAYNYLIKVLNTHKDVTVIWEKSEYTVSRYEIHYDSIIDKTQKNGWEMLHMERRNGKWTPVKFSWQALSAYERKCAADEKKWLEEHPRR